MNPNLDCPDYTVVILAGGWSKRYGRDKANVEWNGIKMINHVAGQVKSMGREVIAVCRREQDITNWSVDSIIHDDCSLPEGPLRGIIRGLTHCNSQWAFVVSCDAPLINPILLCGLYPLACFDYEVVAPIWNNRIQPLVALYHTSSVDKMLGFLLEGDSSPAHAIKRLPHICMSEADCYQLDPQGMSFWNINSPEDWKYLQRYLWQ
jgi:molybdopterin-guanine dinucleotide biosynthesis protein A